MPAHGTVLLRNRLAVASSAALLAFGLITAGCLAIATATVAMAGDVDPATGYRVSNYRSPVTLPPVGGPRIDLAGLDRLRKDGAVLIDVMPARAGYDPANGRWRLVEPREDIPGSIWLPNVGQGVLEPRLAAFFGTSLKRLTAGNLDRPIAFYCMADCWMSWNAVKRAASLGYTNVSWYADGTDGWAEAGRGLVAADPPAIPPLADMQRAETSTPATR